MSGALTGPEVALASSICIWLTAEMTTRLAEADQPDLLWNHFARMFSDTCKTLANVGVLDPVRPSVWKLAVPHSEIAQRFQDTPPDLDGLRVLLQALLDHGESFEPDLQRPLHASTLAAFPLLKDVCTSLERCGLMSKNEDAAYIWNEAKRTAYLGTAHA